MPNAIEKLMVLRDGKAKEIMNLENEIKGLQASLNEAAWELKGIDASIQTVGRNGASHRSEPALPESSGPGRYANVSLSPAILDVINTSGDPPGLLVPEILEQLRDQGFKSQARELYSTVYAAAYRLVKLGQIGESKRDGKRSFIRKE